ncbi:uncharacterized protein LOC114465017 isoform X2 [Gouania willdenowi]|nr:uncharacterized protein LOC114465017 isoform X2 [Gouania willdenowi]
MWQLSDGQQWVSINNDHVIETHYRHPGVKGITLHIGDGRQLVIDFDSMQTSDPALKVQRLVHQLEDVGWYFRDDHLWREYGSQQSYGTQSSSITSKDLEHQFRINPQGSVQFNVGSVQYVLNFSAMTQTNLVTNMNRKVRRRPKLTSSIVSLNSSSVLPSASSQLSDGGYKWEFMADEGVWTEYQAHLCSFDSAAIERHFQLNPQGNIHFKVGGFMYTLKFPEMIQINNIIGTERRVRRVQHNDSSVMGPRWQFKDIDGQWKDYTKDRCSISSQDIEVAYQQNQAGTLLFNTRNFNYVLDFAGMTQKNLSTNMIRAVKRSLS